VTFPEGLKPFDNTLGILESINYCSLFVDLSCVVNSPSSVSMSNCWVLRLPRPIVGFEITKFLNYDILLKGPLHLGHEYMFPLIYI
jgi:hypothetical protein